MIRFALRPHLIYLLQLIIWNLLRNVDIIIIKYALDFSKSIPFVLLMFIGESISGVIFYLYQKKFFKVKKSQTSKFLTISLIEQQEREIQPRDRKYKIFILLFFSSFFSFISFFILNDYLQRFAYLSKSLEMRLNGISTISSAIFCYYLLKLRIFKHQYISLIGIGICLLIIIVLEIIIEIISYHEKLNHSELPALFIALVYIFIRHIFMCFVDSIEKYLFEFDFINIFEALMWEGLLGTILTISYHLIIYYSYSEYIINDISRYYRKNDKIKFSFLIVCLLLYIIFSGGKNVFRVVNIKIYSPMAITLTDYFINPIYLILNFLIDKKYENKIYIVHFIINLVISVIISLFGCIYNDFIILFFCDLEYETHDQIKRRATISSSTSLVSASSGEQNSNEHSDHSGSSSEICD